MVLLTTQNICLNRWIRKYLQFYTQKNCLSKPVMGNFVLAYFRWISVLSNAKEDVLLKAFQDSGSSATMNQNVRELTSTITERIRNISGNKVCCDCGAPGSYRDLLNFLFFGLISLAANSDKILSTVSPVSPFKTPLGAV